MAGNKFSPKFVPWWRFESQSLCLTVQHTNHNAIEHIPIKITLQRNWNFTTTRAVNRYLGTCRRATTRAVKLLTGSLFKKSTALTTTHNLGMPVPDLEKGGGQR